MKSIITLSAIALSTVLFASCTKESLRGHGSIESETRTLSTFSSIEADGSTDIDVYPSSENKVIVTGYANLIGVYETDVRGNTLHLDFKRGYWNIRNNNITVAVYTTDVNSVHLNGSGKIYIHDNIASSTMSVDVNGSGDITVGSNNFTRFDCDINGSGSIKARNADCDAVYADVSGSGDISVTVNELLDVKISGSGSVDYWGTPEVVNSDISGSGKVTKKN
jgi:hypothetical protein